MYCFIGKQYARKFVPRVDAVHSVLYVIRYVNRHGWSARISTLPDDSTLHTK